MAIRTKEFYERMNKVIDKLALTKLSPNENKYCWVEFRKTFAWGKYEDKISRSQMALATGMAETTVSDVKKRLVERNIIHQSNKSTGFNLNTDQWEKVKVSLPFGKVKVSLPKGQGKAEKKGQGIITYKESTKKLTKEGGVVLKKRTRKEIDKLEGKPWLRATMIELEGLPKEGTNEFLSMGNFTECYNAWLELQDAYGIRNKISWLIAKIRKGPAPEE